MRRSFRLGALALLLLGLAFVAGYFADGRRPAETAAAPPPRPAALQIVTRAPERRDFQAALPFQGEVVSTQTVPVTALAAGRIVAVSAGDQQRVQKGDPLFTLGGAEIEGKLQALRQKLAALRRQQKLAAAALQRKRQAAAEKIVTLDAVATARDQAAALQSEAAAATADLDALERATQVRAPASGIFTDRTVGAGQEVSAGTVLAEVVDPAQLRIFATVFPPADAELMGKPAAIAVGGATLTGTVAGVLPTRTAAGGTQVWIAGEDLPRRLWPGETAGGSISLGAPQGTLAVPASALVYDEEEKPLVFVATAQGYRPQPVRTGEEVDGWVAILSGLNGDEQVVIRGAYELFYRDFNRTWREPD